MIHAINQAETVVVPIRDLYNRKINFDENLNLRGKKILYIDTLPITAADTSGVAWHKTFDFRFQGGYKSVSKTDYVGSYLVLVNGTSEIVNRIPIRELQRISNFYEKYSIDKNIDVSKCYIELPENSARELNTAFVFIFYTANDITENNNIIASNFENIELKYTYPSDTVPKTQYDTDPTTHVDLFQRINFPDDEKFRDKKLLYFSIIPTYFDDEIKTNYNAANAILSPSGNMLVLESVVRYSSITLVDKSGKEIINKLPLWLLASRYSDNGFNIKFANLDIDFTKSYIEIYRYDARYKEMSFYFGVYFKK